MECGGAKRQVSLPVPVQLLLTISKSALLGVLKKHYPQQLPLNSQYLITLELVQLHWNTC
jgi:hypothetical protein